MFAHATKRSYTCLKCQYKLSLREAIQSGSQNITTHVRRRWRSSAANAAVEDEDDQDVPVADHRAPITYDTSSSYTTRQWRPTPTADLGVDVLGKPAEILVLPTNKKRRRQGARNADEEAGEDASVQGASVDVESKVQPRIHEYLAQESKPTLMREALENIERIWEEAKNTAVDGFLEREQWLKYHKALSTGFTKKQIERYLVENTSQSQSLPTDSKLSTRSTRPRVAAEIMTKIWGFTNDLPAGADRHISKSVNLGRGRRELILGVDKEWRRFLQHVSVSPSSIRGEVDIAGPESWVNKAQAVFASLKRSVREQVITLPIRYTKALNEQGSAYDVAARSMLQHLIQKHEITMTKRSEWTAFAFSSDRIADFERDVILSQNNLPVQPKDATTPLFLSLNPLDTTSVLPVYKHIPGSRNPEWCRYTLLDTSDDGGTSSQPTGISSDSVNNLIKNLNSQIDGRGASMLGYSFPQINESSIGGIVYESSAAIGQILHQSHEVYHERADHHDPTSIIPRTAFVSRIPYLSQFLTAQEADVPQDDTEGASGSSLLLTFTPSNPHIHPEIEVLASVVTSTAAGAKLNVKSVKLVFPSEPARVVLPTTPFDLEFKRRTSVTIFQYGNVVEENYAPLLGQLGSQMRHEDRPAKDVQHLHLSKLLNLDLECLPFISKTEKEMPKANGKITSARYALDRAELLERQLYRLSEEDEVALEHTAYMPLKLSSAQMPREELRVIPAETETSVTSGEEHETFTKSTFRVIDILTKFVKEQAQEMSCLAGVQ